MRNSSGRRRTIVAVVVLCTAATGVQGAGRPGAAGRLDEIWTAVAVDDVSVGAAFPDEVQTAWPTPRGPWLFRLSRKALVARLDEARASGVAGTNLSLPMPDGSLRRFAVEETHLLAPALAEQLPGVRTFHGRGLDGAATAQITMIDGELHAQVLGADASVMVEPSVDGNYTSADSRSAFAGSSVSCATTGPVTELEHAVLPAGALPFGGRLQTVRVAVATTAEYTDFHGGINDALKAVALTIASVDQVFRRDLGLRLELVAENRKIIFHDPDADGLTNGDPRAMGNEAQDIIAREIGEGNFDLGHALGTVADSAKGEAAGGACQAGEKAKGASVGRAPEGADFNIGLVAHEMAHQLGADHTFNGILGRCIPANRVAATAVEPGSGSTILGYAGVCSFDNLQVSSDPYFHSASIRQVRAFVDTYCGGLATETAAAPNHPPTVDAGGAFSIPIATPFYVEATASDPNGDGLTIAWEQTDLGPAKALASADDGTGPLFRSRPPDKDTAGYFPTWKAVINNAMVPGDRLPAVPRTLRLRVTARDGRGGVAMDDTTIEITPTAGPFRVTSPASGAYAGLAPLTWRVAATDRPPVYSREMGVELATDGVSFSPLVSGTANDGETIVGLPNVTSSLGRLWLWSRDNVFYALSPDLFEIKPFSVAMVVVRVAEGGGPNSPLTPEGSERAEALAELLRDALIDQIQIPLTRQARETAAPVATLLGVQPETYADVAELRRRIGQATVPQRYLVIGDKATIMEMLADLGVEGVAPIEASEHDRLFLVSRTGDATLWREFLYGTGRLVEVAGR